MNLEKPILGISACLLGAKVRHDGGAYTHHWILEELSKFVEFQNFCPEIAMGMGAPRETLRLVYQGKKENISLVTSKGNRDYSNEARSTAEKIFSNLSHLSGFILAKNSPSCGVEAVKLYNSKNNIPDLKGMGFFAKELKEKEPFLPLVDSGRLHNPVERENFIKYMMAYHRLKNIELKTSVLQQFHQKHKYLMMEHSPGELALLGQIAGNSHKKDFAEIYLEYINLFSAIMKQRPTIKTRRNVFYHLLGYFKKDLEQIEKDHFLEQVDQYSNGLIPYASLVSTLKLFIKKYNKEYLVNQIYLEPYPLELGLMKHVE